MRVHALIPNRGFEKQAERLTPRIKRKMRKTFSLLLSNPLHPSLRLHKLSGRLEGHWSVSVTMRYRIIFRPLANGDVLLISVGAHAIYESS